MSRKPGRIALGLGLLTGAVAGLLFAPEEGKKVRGKLAKGDTKGLLDDLMKMGEEMLDSARHLSEQPAVAELLDNAKDKAAEVADMRRGELDDMLKDATKRADNFKKKVKKFVDAQKKELDKHAPKKKKAAPKKKKAVAKKAAPVKKKAAPKKKTVAKKAAPKKKAVAKKTTKKAAPKKKK